MKKHLMWGMAGLLLVGCGTTLPEQGKYQKNAVVSLSNSGFESGLTGWSTSGTASAAFTESGGRSGSYRLSHWSNSAYQVSTYRTVSGLADGWYTLKAWVKSGGGQNTAFISLKGCGNSNEYRAYLPTVSDGWVNLAVSAYVTGGSCTISLYSDAKAGNWANFDDIELSTGQSKVQITGADISSLAKSEAKGGIYRNSAGTAGDAIALMKNGGVNYARLKVWVNPQDGYNNKTRVLAMAKRIKAAGMKLLIDFHYSDTWADPGKQNKPAAWANHTINQLYTDVYDHTLDVCNALKAQGTTPDMVQVGNEINGGMLWPEGSTSNWAQLAGLLKSGVNAVKTCSSTTRIMLHLAEGGNNAGARAWFDQAVARGVPFDVIGLSHYTYWHGSLASLQANLYDLSSRYNKDVLVAETAYPFTLSSDDSFENIINTTAELTAGYSATPADQARMLRDTLTVVRAVPRALGVFYWEAPWTAVTGNGWDPADASSGNGWDNQALFDFSDRELPALREFLNP